MQRGQYSSVKYHLNTKSFYELAEIFIQCSKYHTKMMQIPVYTQFWKSSLSKRSIGIIILLTAWVRHSFNTAMVSVPFMVVPELRDRWQLLLGSAPHLPTMEWLPPIRPLSLVPTMLVPPAALSAFLWALHRKWHRVLNWTRHEASWVPNAQLARPPTLSLSGAVLNNSK